MKLRCTICQAEFTAFGKRALRAKYCSPGCHGKAMRESPSEQTPHWTGARTKMANGYIMITVNKRRVYEHRHIMEQHLGRHLEAHEIPHHINGDKTDNEIENLQLMDTRVHSKMTDGLRGYYGGSRPGFNAHLRSGETRVCVTCHQDFYVKGSRLARPFNIYCPSCRRVIYKPTVSRSQRGE